MFNSSEPNSYPYDYFHQEDDSFNKSDEDNPHVNLNGKVHQIRQAAFESCISSIEVENSALSSGIWNKVHGIARKQWFREAVIIATILLFRTCLFISYREAHKANLEIENL